jgi:hypothetical protein
LPKPFNIADVSLIAQRALERNRLIDENSYLREELRARYNFDNIVGSRRKFRPLTFWPPKSPLKTPQYSSRAKAAPAKRCWRAPYITRAIAPTNHS